MTDQPAPKTPDHLGFVERAATPIGNTDSVPQGTMLTVPASPPTGPSGTAPIVAANNVHWYEDRAFMTAIGGAAIAISDPIIEAMTSSQPFHWRPVVAGCILALVAYFRSRYNSVVK